MENMNQPKFKSKVVYSILGALSFVVFASIVIWQYQTPERKSDAINDDQAHTGDIIDNNDQTEDNVPICQKYYDQGTKELSQKNYNEAIKFFDQAIKENPYEPQYYSDKSQAQYNLGDKQAAIETLKQGSSLNPDSDLLKSKLDVLNKDQFSDPNAETPRE